MLKNLFLTFASLTMLPLATAQAHDHHRVLVPIPSPYPVYVPVYVPYYASYPTYGYYPNGYPYCYPNAYPHSYPYPYTHPYRPASWNSSTTAPAPAGNTVLAPGGSQAPRNPGPSTTPAQGYPPTYAYPR